MRLAFTPEQQTFRLEVRGFVQKRLPASIRRKVELGARLGHDDYVTWFNLLESRGWLTPNWPVEHGGPGWDPVQRYLFDEETLLGGAPRIIASGIQMLGPVLIAFGTPEHKARYLPDIRASRTWWAQGFSEPDAGSDLASLRTRAQLSADGRHFVVSGHKVWTSYTQWCSMMFALVRTDPQAAKPQEGISFLLIDMKAPGVTVRPIRMLEGGSDLNAAVLRAGLPQRLMCYVAPLLLGGQDAKGLFGRQCPRRLRSAVPLKNVRIEPVGRDMLIEADFETQ